MGAYFVLQIDWTSDSAYHEYARGISGMIEKHGGEFIVASRNFRVVEGTWGPGRLVVIRFPTMEALSAWYDSAEYQPLRELRLQHSHSDAVITEGD